MSCGSSSSLSSSLGLEDTTLALSFSHFAFSSVYPPVLAFADVALATTLVADAVTLDAEGPRPRAGAATLDVGLERKTVGQ